MTHNVKAEDAGVRLDVFLSRMLPELTRSAVQLLLENGQVTLSGVPVKKNRKTAPGEVYTVEVPEVREIALVPQDIPLDVVYEDGDVIVVNKPRGMVVHPAPGHPDGTLVNALLKHLDHLSGIGGEIRPGIVHRIDKDTSGLLLVAKNDFSHLSLSEQIKEHSVQRAYMAIVQGGMRQDSGSVEGPIGRHPVDRKKMAIVPDGREAMTHWRVMERLKGATLLECRLTTGRTHQIRVHMTSIGHPLLGDPLYGPKKMPYPVRGGQLLHAFRIGFVHPRTGEEMLFEAPPEERFLMWQRKLKNT